MAFKSKVKQKVETLKKELEDEQEYQSKPMTNRNVFEISSISEPVFERLYSLKPQYEPREDPEATFKPMILNCGTFSERPEKVQDLLYQDAVKRRINLFEKQMS